MSSSSQHPRRALVVVIDSMSFSSMRLCRAHVVVKDGRSFSSMNPCWAYVVSKMAGQLREGIFQRGTKRIRFESQVSITASSRCNITSSSSQHPRWALVVVIDSRSFSSMRPCRAHVVVRDGRSFSSMNPCWAYVVTKMASRLRQGIFQRVRHGSFVRLENEASITVSSG